MNEKITTADELLSAYRDDTLKNRHVDIPSADLRGANLSEADLREANLSEANLRGADLRGANWYRADLSGANLLSSIGIYNVFGLGMSSRKDKLCGGLMLEDGEIQLFLQAGCQRCSPAKLHKKVQATHGENSYAQQYEIAITCIEKLFAVDMASGKWDYLKTWEVDHSKAKENKS